MSNQRYYIPNWKMVKLGGVTEIIKGGTPSRNVERYFRGNIAWAIPSDVTALDSALYIDNTETHITEEALNNSAAILLPVGTVLLTSRATIGDTAINTGPMATNQGFANFICHENLSNVFLAYYLRYIKKKLNDLASGSTFKEITKGTLLNIEIPDIPIQEQRAIAEVLSDVDGLINALDALIAKKRAIKQATMQQLLTGKTRLPGFSGDWETKRLGEISDINPQNFSSNTDPDYKFNYVTLEQVDSGKLLGYSEEVFQTAPSRAQRILRNGDVLMSTVRPNLMAHLFFQEQVSNAVCSTGFAVLRAKEDLSVPYFLFSQLFSEGVNDQIDKILSGSNYPAINRRDVKLIEISCPPYVEEQRAVVTVLSDMDTEIAALEQRRDKTIVIKQGMMQQLLTGKVRLLKSE